MHDLRVEAAARAQHAALNSGVGIKDSPLSWETEAESTRQWHLAAAAAALEGGDAYWRSTNTMKACETTPNAYCETCDRNIADERDAHDGHDVIDFLSGEITDPLEIILSGHWTSFLRDEETRRLMCRCAEWFDGPVYHRRHIARLIRMQLDVAGEETGQTLHRARLALTALALGDADECTAILSALCGYLVDRGVIDPMELW